jgi:hypothetical protein
MAHLNHIGGLKREFHHIKAMRGDGHEEWEPSMVLLRDELMGRSFVVPLSCFWKYLDPRDNLDMRRHDQAEFDRLAEKILFKRQWGLDRQTTEDAAAIVMAEQMNMQSGVMLCTAYSLVKCCQLLEITVSGQSLAQLLMFIQDGLEQLKNMPEYTDEGSTEVGDIKAEINGQTFHTAAMLSDTDIVAGE